MGQIVAKSDQLRSTAEELRVLNENFKSQIDLLSAAESTLSNMWEGSAHDVFHLQFNSDKMKWFAFYSLVQSYYETLKTIAKQYEAAEAHNAALYGKQLSVGEGGSNIPVLGAKETTESPIPEKPTIWDYLDSGIESINNLMLFIESREDILRQAFKEAVNLHCAVAIGLSGSLGTGAYLAGAIQLAIGPDGSVALQVCYGAGGEAGSSGDASLYVAAYPGADSPQALEGICAETGGSFGEGLILGGGLLSSINDEAELAGGYISLGAGAEGTFLEGHVNFTNTSTIMDLGNISTMGWDILYKNWEKVYTGWNMVHDI